MDRLHYANSIHHSGSLRYVFPNHAHIGDTVTIRLRAALNAPVKQVFLRTAPDGEQNISPMHPEAHDQAAVCRWWRASIRLTMPVSSYRFLILADDRTSWYNASGLHAHNPTDAEDFRILVDYEAPSWLKNSVFYQIFPDRFADGDPSNNVRDGEYEYAGYPAHAREWGAPPTSGSRAAMVEFYGGDLAGIISHLDHLKDLGVNALYLNPIFTAFSNHRYDVTDYFSVDPHLGGNPALENLHQALSARGMRYILDIVPNHCGYLHPWFQAAQSDPSASTADYFTFRKHPNEYESWLGVRSLVKLNYRSAALRNVMYAGPNSVFRQWLRPPYSADGWRIDVANMLARQGADQLGMEVGRGIRQAVKAENSQAYLIGENFFDASNQLQGDCWDGVMNYSGFAMPLMDWLGSNQVFGPNQSQPINPGIPLTTQALVDSWRAFRAAIPWVIAAQQYNLIGSHDTPRAMALLSGNRDLFKLSVTLLFTYPGIPSIYYGDEIGLGGGHDTNPRLCMSWEPSTWDTELLAFYKVLTHLRRTSPALADGGFQVLFVEDDTLIFQRDTDEEIILVVARRGSASRPAGPVSVSHGAIPDQVEFEEIFTHQRISVQNGNFSLPVVTPGAQVWMAHNR
ncbi:MAG: alpha-glycosidase [Chloroflexi bacterium RBG_13_48_10]|nr:MAG: alpha-glycosidase [Chloroflexi bacterium RBG_13_48_10]